MKVTIFSTCLIDLMFPHVGQAMVEVLERLGIETELPDKQICCGQPTFNSGYGKESYPVFKNQIDAFEGADYIVAPAGSCAGMMKELPHFFEKDDPYYEKAVAVAERTYEFTQFLYRVLGVKDLGATLNKKGTYHRSCHMTRILGEREAPFILLGHVKDLEMVPLPHIENCCGFGGTFSVKEPAISEMMVTEKVNDIVSTNAEVLISADMGCLMNIGGKLNRDGIEIKVMHIAEVLNTNVDLDRMDQPQLQEVEVI